MLTTLRFNLANSAIRHETLHGKRYIVAPMVMLTEGVHNGSGGPLLYREGDIKRAAPAWNMKPIVVYHPQINGQGVSACDPDVLQAQQVGMVMKTTWNGKLRAEAWVDEERAAAVDARVLDALEQNKLMEVSTGLFTENVEEVGDWNGEEYKAIATNHQPDHLALLPDQIGACSVADGAGLLMLNEAAQAAGVENVDRMLAREMDILRRMIGNAMSHSNTHAALSIALKDRFKPGEKQFIWIVDVYDDRVVYEFENDGKITLFSLGYAKIENGVTLSTDPPIEVVRVTEYRTSDGKFVGNNAHATAKDDDMKKEQIVDRLIANKATPWSDGDRKLLLNMEDAALEKLDTAAAAAVEPEVEEKPKAAQDTVPEKPVENKTPQTTEEYINAAPPDIRQMLQNGLAAHEAEKTKLIDEITANTANPFTPEFLRGKGIDELRGLAQLATNGKPKEAGNGVVMFYGGATPATVPVNNASHEEGLELPVMNFEAANT